MKLLRGNGHFAELNNGSVATIGNFDGVHLGHQRLLGALKEQANTLHLPLVIILFEPQPREYFHGNNAPARLSSLREKLDKLKQCQVDYVYLIKFNQQLAETNATKFAQQYLFHQLNIKYLLIGEDFKFGKNREGDVSLLKKLGEKYGCAIDVYRNFCIKDERVSSTKVRLALQNNELDTVSRLLGRPYDMCGRVINGAGRGRQWGIPTANLALKRLTLPLQGVFVIKAAVASQTVYGVANIGKRPTVDGSKNILEIHLFNFNRSIYGELMHVAFLHKLRDEIKFSSVDTLIAQIHDDINAAKAYLHIKTD